ncbi:MAG: ABC transporter ATP-binding protein [Candidatus Lustribacter sp.]
MTIALNHLTKRFGKVTAVDDVTLSIRTGALTAIVGPSGCGKSTLLRLLAGFEEPDAGSIIVDGIDVTGQPVRERGVGFVFQSYALFPHLTVARNVAFPLEIRGEPPARVRERIRELLELVQLPDLAERRPHQLSGGQRQRVALARALAAAPRFLFLDEPFAALDYHVRRDLRTQLRALHETVHVTTLLVTHDAEEAMEIADDVVLMREGRIEQSGSPSDVYDAPASPFALHFLGPANAIPDGDAVRFVRPHELRVAVTAFSGSRPARVTRVIHLGARRRYELLLSGNVAVTADVSGSEPPFAEGADVHVAASLERSFAGSAAR